MVIESRSRLADILLRGCREVLAEEEGVMDKQLAKSKSIEGKLSIADLRGMISERRKTGGMSRVNPMFTIEQVCDIYEGAIAGRDGTETPAGMKYDGYKRHDVPSKDSLIIKNILRDCA
jgi:hypothetical protein